MIFESLRGAMLVWVALFHLVFISEPVSLENRHYGVVRDEKQLAAADFHGIRVWVEEVDGELWFKRRGQWCRLYTDGFLRVWGERR